MIINGDKNGPRADNLVGTGGMDIIDGRLLADSLYGAGGDDDITGGSGVLTTTGLALLYARRFFDRFDVAHGPVFKLIPVGSALVIAVAGLGVAFEALIQAGLVG